MPRIGQGMLLILNDVDPSAEDEFNRWYDTEHMIERVSIEGFLGASRYRVVEGVRTYGALYWTKDVGVFQSAAYKEALQRQSPWSGSILTTFVDPHRAVGNLTKAIGYGRGSHVGLVRLPSGPLRETERETWSESIMPAVAVLPGVVSVQLFESVPHLSGPVAQYRPTTRPLANPDDCILIVESASASAVSWPVLAPLLGPYRERSVGLGTFALTWELDGQDVESS